MTKVNKMPDMDAFRTFLKRHALKATAQRMAVHEAMLSLGHASVDTVTDMILKKGEVKVTIATVYNILSQLAELGLYDRRLSANSKMYFDVNSFTHVHLYDIVNHEFIDIFDDELVDMIKSKLAKKKFKGYKTAGFDLQIVCKPTRRRVVRSI